MLSNEKLSIDKISTALVIIDLQKGIVARKKEPYDSETVISNAAKLAGEFRKNKMPVFLVHVDSSEYDRLKPVADETMQMPGQMPEDWADFVPELSLSSEDVIITKKQWGAFYGTELDLQLRRRGIRTIVLCGISTNIGVESTARFAYEYGYNQVFAEDALSAASAEQHNNTINFIFKRIGLVRKTDEIINILRK